MFLETLEALKRVLSNKHFILLLDEIRLHADFALKAPIPHLSFSLFHLFAATGERASYEKLYFTKRGRLSALALAYLLYEETDYLLALEDELWAICDEYTWSLPAHVSADGIPAEITVDLFAAETAHGLAEILFMLGERLQPAVQKRICREIEKRIFSSMFDEPSTRLGWETAKHNWSAVCAGAVGMAAILLVQDQKRLTLIIERVSQAMKCFLDGYGEDGGCAEGISYWVYGFGYYVYYAEMLYDYTNGKIDLLDTPKVRAIAAFPAKIQLSKQIFVNFSDAAEASVLPSGLLSRLAIRTGQTYEEPLRLVGFHEDSCYRWAHLIRNLLWTDGELLERKHSSKNNSGDGSQMFEDLQWVVDRRTVGEHIIGFAAKGGHNNEPHNHNDLGHFIVHVAGQNVLFDLGAGIYTKSYFGDGRYEVINNSSAGHSVPVVNGCLQIAGKQSAAEMLLFKAHSAGLDLQLDLTSAYPLEANLERFTRFFRWEFHDELCRVNLIMKDQLMFRHGNSAAIKECFMSCVPARESDEGIEWKGEAGKVKLAFNKQQFKVELEELPLQDHQGNWIVVYRTSLTVEQTERVMDYGFSFSVEVTE